ncbi:MAG: DUF4199 domain-containing protein [Bacteroidota bacterium]|nr:DUF4199 domain-containing protein [Bacteroidota bacterium]
MNSFKHSLPYAAGAALISIAFGVVLFVLSMLESPVGFLSIGGFILMTVLGLKSWREKIMGGVISYGQSFGYLTLLTLSYTVIITIWTFVFGQYIAYDEFKELEALKVAEVTNDLRTKYKMSEGDIEKAMSFSKMLSGPGFKLVLTFLGSMFVLSIINLITAAFMKKDAPENFETSPNTAAH